MKSKRLKHVAGQAALSFGKRQRRTFVGARIQDIPVIALSDYERDALAEARMFKAEIAHDLEAKDQLGLAGITYREFKKKLEKGVDKIKARATVRQEITYQEVRSELLSIVENIYADAHQFAEHKRPTGITFFLDLFNDTLGKTEATRPLHDALNQAHLRTRQPISEPISVTQESVDFSIDIARNIVQLMDLFDSALYSEPPHAHAAFKKIVGCEDAYRKRHPKLVGWYPACDIFRIMARNIEASDQPSILATYAYAVQALGYDLAGPASLTARPCTPLTLIRDSLQRMDTRGYIPLDQNRRELTAVVDRLQGYLSGLRKCEKDVELAPARKKKRRALLAPQSTLFDQPLP